MRSKKSLIALTVRVLVLCSVYFASFTAWLYLPHQSLWWRVAGDVLIVMLGFGAVRGSLRRIKVRLQNTGKDLGRA